MLGAFMLQMLVKLVASVQKRILTHFITVHVYILRTKEKIMKSIFKLLASIVISTIVVVGIIAFLCSFVVFITTYPKIFVIIGVGTILIVMIGLLAKEIYENWD